MSKYILTIEISDETIADNPMWYPVEDTPKEMLDIWLEEVQDQGYVYSLDSLALKFDAITLKPVEGD